MRRRRLTLADVVLPTTPGRRVAPPIPWGWVTLGILLGSAALVIGFLPALVAALVRLGGG